MWREYILTRDSDSEITLQTEGPYINGPARTDLIEKLVRARQPIRELFARAFHKIASTFVTVAKYRFNLDYV